MGLEKIEDFTKNLKKICRHPEHEPPRFIVLSPGRYKHTCPCCGHVTNFTVPLIWY